MNITVPHAEDVRHEMLEAAKPLLLLGWTAPAALTARVALEQCLRQLAMDADVFDRCRLTAGQMILTLQRKQVIGDRFGLSLMATNDNLNRVAHGDSLTMFRAVNVVESVEHHVREIQLLSL